MYDLSKEAPSIRKQIVQAGLPMKTIGKEFSDLDPTPALEAVKKWVARVVNGEIIQKAGSPSCGLGIMLVGNPGHGKTTMASTALQSLIRGIPADVLGIPGGFPKRIGGFMDYPKLLRLQKSQFSDEDEATQILLDGIYGDSDRMNNVRVFVLDDIGKEYRTASGWAENTFDALLRSRFNAGLPTIVTTNVPLENWGSVYGSAMGSFAMEAFIPIEVEAPQGDRRG
jgi:DNA replication protein DnaC